VGRAGFRPGLYRKKPARGDDPRAGPERGWSRSYRTSDPSAWWGDTNRNDRPDQASEPTATGRGPTGDAGPCHRRRVALPPERFRSGAWGKRRSDRLAGATTVRVPTTHGPVTGTAGLTGITSGASRTFPEPDFCGECVSRRARARAERSVIRVSSERGVLSSPMAPPRCGPLPQRLDRCLSTGMRAHRFTPRFNHPSKPHRKGIPPRRIPLHDPRGTVFPFPCTPAAVWDLPPESASDGDPDLSRSPPPADRVSVFRHAEGGSQSKGSP
jgi:hypothetical protein